jgi:acyl-CoA reductase-like NAD-dependent aldehyde dehydrogenase
MAVAMSKAQAGTGTKRAQMLIDGSWVDAVSGKEILVESPGNRRTIGSVPRGQAEDIGRAVKAAAAAFPAWSHVVPRDRGRLLQKIADAVEARVEELARIIAEETGNALRTQARPEARGAADIIRYFGGLASELKGETIPLGEHVLSYTRREPIGVVGAIIPWNAPVILAALKIAPALCAGNTLVLKAPRWGCFGWRPSAASICPRACSTSSPATARRPVPRSPRILACASSPSLGPPRSASSS